MRNLVAKLIFCSMLVFTFAAAQTANAAEHMERKSSVSAPMLVGLKQISPNQLQVTYDQTVDPSKAINPKNYWIQSTGEQTPTNIATLGKNDNVNANNSLTADKVTIQAADKDGKSFVLTFNTNIAKGTPFKLIICYVTKPGAPAYQGNNGSATFVGQ